MTAAVPMTRRAALASLAALAGPMVARAAAQAGDLGYLVAIEEAQVALYQRGRSLPLSGRGAALAGRFANHEKAHLERIRELVKTSGQVTPVTFDFPPENFLSVAQRVEGLAVSAYNGAIPRVRDGRLRAELAAIAQTEARHSAAIRDLRHKPPAPRAFEPGAPPDRIQRALAALQAS